MSFFSENREGFEEYYIPENFYENRELGLSAMIRIKDEEEWIGPSLESIIDWMDEIIICFQNSTDQSEEIAKQYPVKIYHYPFDSYPNGPGLYNHPQDSIFTRAYFYNWALAKTTKTHVYKWDGDMVAMDWWGELAKKIYTQHDVIATKGIDIVGSKLKHIGRPPFRQNPSLFKITKETYFKTGPIYEVFNFPGGNTRPYTVPDPVFLHFKWVKNLKSATQGWPKNWREIPHFKKIFRETAPIEEYQGEYPKVIRELLNR